MSTALQYSRVKVERECYIPIPKHRIVDSLLAQLSDESEIQLFRDFCRLIEAIYHFEYHQVSQTLKCDYELFDPTNTQVHDNTISEDDYVNAEDRLLKHFLQIMEKGNFSLLTQQDIDVAEAEEYMFTLPITIDWDQLDDEMLGRYFNNHQEEYDKQNLPGFVDKILIFRRGTGVDTTRGFLTLQKIDVIISRLILGIINLFRRKKVDDVNHPGSSGEQTQDNKLEQTHCSHIHGDEYIDRITLRNSKIGLLSLFRRTTLQEPTFKEVVILFRYATPKPTRKVPEPTKERAIYIKTFYDIPMADLEVVFPEKKISMKPLDLIKLVITGFIGVFVVIFRFLSVAVINPILALVGLVTIGGYAAKVFLGYKISRDRYQHVVTQSLYHKTRVNDLGVIFYLMDSLEEQEFKEAVLAYFALWKQGPMTEPELDRYCETYLYEQFAGVCVDFEVDDALTKLVKEGLVIKKGDKYEIEPLVKALEKLDHKWDNYFQYNN